MKTDQMGSLEALAEVIAARVNGASRGRPKFRSIPPPEATEFDSITRNSIFRRISWLSRTYHLQWLVEQSTFNRPNVHCLSDVELGNLLRDMERARECLSEGIGFEEAGLIRNNADDLPR